MAPEWPQSVQKCTGSLSHKFSWRPRGPLDPSKFIGKINIFCFWARLGRAQGDMICITGAIRRLYAVLGIHFSLSGHCLPLFSWKLTPKWLQLHPWDALNHQNILGKWMFFKTDQNYSKLTFICPKWSQSDPKVGKVTPKWPRIGSPTAGFKPA